MLRSLLPRHTHLRALCPPRPSTTPPSARRRFTTTPASPSTSSAASTSRITRTITLPPAPQQPPPSPTTSALPYAVARTRSANLPVYEEAKAGGSKRQTRVRGVRGSATSLAAALSAALASPGSPYNAVTSVYAPSTPPTGRSAAIKVRERRRTAAAGAARDAGALVNSRGRPLGSSHSEAAKKREAAQHVAKVDGSVRVNSVNGHVVVKGWCRAQVVRFLVDQGF